MVLVLVLALLTLACSGTRAGAGKELAKKLPAPPQVPLPELPRQPDGRPANPLPHWLAGNVLPVASLAASLRAALERAGSAPSEQPGTDEQEPEVPAPMDEMAGVELEPAAGGVREAVEAELATTSFDLPLVINDPVLAAVSFFQTPRGRAIVETGLRRAGRYREMIERVLDEEGLPRDLLYLAQAESAFQPTARSRMRAVGLWQFITSRAQEYGLRVDWWVDERRDPEKSTRAAARHLRDLYHRFGDWYLAMAAYNSGPLNVERAIERTGYADFWELRRALPRETRNYVPLILALTLVAKNPERYGIQVEPEPPQAVERVRIEKPLDLRLVAETIGSDTRTLRELNPHLLHGVTPRQSDFELAVPAGTAEALVAALPTLPEDQRVRWPRHTVRRGETLSGIAARYGSSAAALAEVNGISLRSLIHPGQVLVVPPTASTAVARQLRAGSAGPARAERTTASTRAGNNGNGGDRREGRTVHRVRPGDTLWGLARRYQTSIEALRRANQFLATRDLQANDQLLIPD